MTILADIYNDCACEIFYEVTGKQASAVSIRATSEALDHIVHSCTPAARERGFEELENFYTAYLRMDSKYSGLARRIPDMNKVRSIVARHFTF